MYPYSHKVCEMGWVRMPAYGQNFKRHSLMDLKRDDSQKLKLFPTLSAIQASNCLEINMI